MTQGTDRHARSLLWLTADDLARLNRTTLIVVGCGGTGSVAAVQAAFSGIGRLVLCDADALDITSLNRFQFATPADVDRLKVDIVAEYLGSHVPSTTVVSVPELFPHEALIPWFENDETVVMGCVDDVPTRLALDVLCRRFGLTLIDIGTGFAAGVDNPGEAALSSGGQVLVSRPSGPCLTCLGITRTPYDAGYMLGPDRHPEPSLLALNALVASLGTEILISERCGGRRTITALWYSRNDLTIDVETADQRDAGCAVCGPSAARSISSVLQPFSGVNVTPTDPWAPSDAK